MKKHLFALSLSLCMAFGLGSTAFGQEVTEKNGTPQAPNYDFEAWDNPEPWGWNSSSSFEAGNVPSSEERNQSVWSSNDTRPGSKGQYSARLQVTLSKWKNLSHWFSKISALMGSLTTGVPYYANENLQNEKSCLYTNTGDGSKRWEFTGRPDSVVFWVKKGLNGGRPADFTMYLHDNAKLEDRNPNGTASGTVIGSASCKITNTDWQRISLPIEYASDATPVYLLASFTAGNNFREVVEGDELYVDDMMFIYKPSLHIDLDDVVPVPVHKTQPLVSFEVPYTLYGTMSPFNLEEDNVIYAELSDENGSFDTPTTLGSLTTDESGTMVCQFASDLPFNDESHYKLRLRATNYPLLSENTVELAFYYVYRLNITEPEPAWAAEINTVDTLLPENSAYTALCGNIMPGLHLSQWLLNGEAVSNALSYTLTMDRDYTLTAQFDTNYYAVTVSATVGGGIELDGADGTQTRYEAEIIHNAVLNLSAAADFGYHFREWQLNGETLSADNPLTYTVTAVSDLTAVFDTNVYEIAFSATPADMGSASNSGAYKHFTAAASTATPAPYAQFSHWRKAGETEAVSYEPTLLIESVSAAVAYEAVFASQTFDVTTAVEPAESGRTEGDATYEAFPLTQQAQVSAQANEGYHFTYWTYAIDGTNQTDRPTDNPLVFVENGHVAHAYAFTAHFDLNRYALTVDAEHGMAEGAGTFEHGAAVTLSATPDYGYAFNGWYENGDLLGSEPTLTLTLTAERHLTAMFTPLTYTLTFGVNDPTLGRITQPTEAEGAYEHFTALTVTAEATEGNEFRHWIINGEDVNGEAALTLTVDGSKTVVAFFTPLRKQLSVLNLHEERGTTTGEGLYEHGAAAELTANAAFGYRFISWTDDEGETYTANPLRIDALTANRTLTVHFETMPFELCLDNPLPGFGTYTVNGETPAEACTTFPYLHTVTLAATPAAEKRFVGWKNAETDEMLFDNPLQLTMRADLKLTAIFDNAVYTVQGAAYPTEAATITGSDDYYLNATAVLEAMPRFGFTFTGWYDEQGERLTTDLRYEFQVEKAVYYAARFNRNNYTLNLTAEPTDGGTVTGGGERPYGYNTKVEALPNEGRQFNGWFDGQGTLVSDQAVYYPTVLKDETLTAHFGPKALNVTLTCEPVEAGEIKRLGQADAGFFYNETVEFLAQANEVYTFSHWTDADGKRYETANLALNPTTDLQLTAHFTPRADLQADITVQPANAGQLVNLPETWVYGQIYTVEVNQTDNRYTFAGWRDAEGAIRSTQTAYTFTFDQQPLVALFEAKAVAVHTVCEPELAGQVTLTGETRYFEEVTLTAQAARGYRFAAWRNAQGETLDRTEAELTWNLDGDLSLTAVFEPESYDLLVAALPEAGGLIAGPATARYGETVTLTATANDGYTFQAYEDADGKPVSYEETLTTTINGPLTLNARFTPRTYTLRAVSADKTLGQAKGSGLFAFGETVTVKAWPMAAGYTFSHWSADPKGHEILSDEAEYQYTMTAEDRTIYACFKRQTLQLELTANLPQAGTLQGGGEKTYGETVTVSATANEGYIWQGFSEYDLMLTGETAWTFTMTENRHIVGVFTPMMWQITATDIPEGVKVKGTGEAAHGTEAVIEAVLPNTLDLVAWTDAEGNTVGTENPLRLTVLGNLQLTPLCTPRLLPLNVTIEPAGAGSVITDGFTDNAGAFTYGEDIALKVAAARGYAFVGWEEDGVLISTENPYTYRILAESQLKAVFQPAGWTITTGTNLSLGGTTAGDGIYPQGQTVEVTATPAAGFEFMHWSENGEIVSTDAVYRFEADNDRMLLADFQIHYFQIQVEANPTIAAKVSGSGAYSAQDTVTLTVTPTNGYAFIGWTCDGDTLSHETTYRFVPERDMPIVAQMKKLTTTVSANASPLDGGTVTGGGEYRVGERVTLNAIPNENFDFLQWVDNRQNIVSLDQTFSFTAGDDVYYIAEFGRKIDDTDMHSIVYPTPFSGEVHLEGDNMDKIVWFNAFGVKVAQYEINSNTHTIMTTDSWPRGLYIYRIVGNSGKVVKGKALKL